ncbi:MAG: glutamine amidotransferase [bacterium]
MIIYEHTVPAAVIVAGALVAVAVSFVGYWFYAKREWTLVPMVVLRALFLILLAWCLFMPGLRSVQTLAQKSRFLVLVDKSQSMTMTPVKDATNRWQVAQGVLGLPWLATLAEKCDIDIYSFDADVSGKLALDEVTHLTPNGTSTLLRDALNKTVGRYQGLDVTGCLLLSDGIDTREAFSDWSLEKRPFPIYSMALEKNAVWDEEPDVRVETVNTPRRVTVGWQSELKAVISGQGTKGLPIRVQLLKDGAPLQEQETQIPAGGGSREVVFSLDHSVVGISTYSIVLPPFPKESQTNDNQFALNVQVLDAKNRLMYVEGTPRWESKYLSRTLRESKTVNPAIFLRGPKGKFMTFGVRGDVAPDMQESQLAMFKIVILGNLSAEELGEERARTLVKFVETGGSLVLLGGTKAWSPEGFVKTGLKAVLPAKAFTAKAQEGEFPVRLTDQGRSHAAFAGDVAFWEKVPPVLSIFPKVIPSPAARVLVEAKTAEGMQPMILVQDFGQGKVVAIFSDSIWKWQLSPDAMKNKPYSRFWNQLVSWLSPKLEKTEGKAWDVFMDRDQCFLGEEVEITARWTGSDKPPQGAVVKAEITMPDKRKVPFSMTSQMNQVVDGKSAPVFSVKFKGELAGMYSVLAASDTGGPRLESDTLSFSVKPFTPESVPRPAAVEIVKAVTVNSGGVFFESAEELDRALAALQPKKLEQEISEFKSLWQHWAIISCLIALISIEWIIRKLRNLT